MHNPVEAPHLLVDAKGFEDLVRRGVRAEIGSRLDDLHRFVDRRIAELSMEISATVQMVDFSETNLSGQLAKLQEQVGGLVGAPSLEARNSGLELEAVVQATETAANRIMEAAEAIDTWVHTTGSGGTGLEAVTEKISAIFEACSFQDLTSQRIRRAIEHLQQVESMLGRLAGTSTEPAPPMTPPTTTCAAGADLMQNEIDRLMAF